MAGREMVGKGCGNKEGRMDGLHQELAETHERLDFAERLLSQARDERRIGD